MIYDLLNNKTIWENYRHSEAHRFLLEDLEGIYKKFEGKEIPLLKYSDFKRFYENGNRQDYEAVYFAKRRRLSCLALLSLIYPEKAQYMEELQDVIWSICDDYSWTLPAHIPTIKDNTYIGLFSAETAFALSDIYLLLKDRMDEVINHRIVAELKRRIVDSFESIAKFRWEEKINNWPVVCACGILVTYINVFPERLEAAKPRLMKMVESFLSGYNEEGICLEGGSYWNFGFGAFADFAKRLYDYTEGRENLFAVPKVHMIAKHLQNTALEKGLWITFSDNSSTGYNLGLVHFLAKIYNDVEKQSLKQAIIHDNKGSWNVHLSSFLDYNEAFVSEEDIENKAVLFEQTGWYMQKNNIFSFAAKAGNNDEPHNHNDIGSFIVTYKGKHILCDLGAALYDRDYFNENRYKKLTTSSRGHSVPIINNNYQLPGKEHAGTIEVDESEVYIDMTHAYGERVVQKLLRTFSLEDGCIIIKDKFSFENGNNHVCERFVTFTEPIVKNNCIFIDNVMLECSLGAAAVTWEDYVQSRFVGSKRAYMIDFGGILGGDEVVYTKITFH